LHDLIQRATGGNVVDWLDSHFVPPRGEYFNGPILDGELEGLEFLAEDMRARAEWRGFWPQTGTPPCWDAVGFVHVKSQVDLLLVEAKAHIGELQSSCKAKEEGGRPKIMAATAEAKAAFGVGEDHDWLGPYYQFCNRLTALHFLMSRGIGARLLFIYFYGDTIPGAVCPATPLEWEQPIAQMYAHVGLADNWPLRHRVHQLFLPVGG
jgi:hypothetical protein